MAAGKRAVFAEISEERRDLMVLRIGNIGAGEEVRVELTYVEELSIAQNTFYLFDLPIVFS